METLPDPTAISLCRRSGETYKGIFFFFKQFFFLVNISCKYSLLTPPGNAPRHYNCTICSTFIFFLDAHSTLTH